MNECVWETSDSDRDPELCQDRHDPNIGCSTCLMFSKKCPYWMVLMPVYVETAEGLVKPPVILPAAVMPLPPFILIFS